jgi:hypothetical protein
MSKIRPVSSLIATVQYARGNVTGPGLLADAVVPVSYAVKGSAFAVSLWYYKSRRPPGRGAQRQRPATVDGACGGQTVT